MQHLHSGYGNISTRQYQYTTFFFICKWIIFSLLAGFPMDPPLFDLYFLCTCSSLPTCFRSMQSICRKSEMPPLSRKFHRPSQAQTIFHQEGNAPNCRNIPPDGFCRNVNCFPVTGWVKVSSNAARATSVLSARLGIRVPGSAGCLCENSGL